MSAQRNAMGALNMPSALRRRAARAAPALALRAPRGARGPARRARRRARRAAVATRRPPTGQTPAPTSAALGRAARARAERGHCELEQRGALSASSPSCRRPIARPATASDRGHRAPRAARRARTARRSAGRRRWPRPRPLGARVGAGERRVEIAAGDGGGPRAGAPPPRARGQIRVGERARAPPSARLDAVGRQARDRADAVAGGRARAPSAVQRSRRAPRGRTPSSASSARTDGRARRRRSRSPARSARRPSPSRP